MKIKLLYDPIYSNNINRIFLEALWDQYFVREPIDTSKTYNPTECLIYSDFSTADQWIQPWQEKGFKTIVDHLWDSWICDKWETTDQQLVLRSTKWFWHNECFCFRHLGYQNLKRTSIDDKTFLLLMNQLRRHRKELYQRIKPILDTDAIYSFRGLDIPLQNAQDSFDLTTTAGDRYTDIDWYNRTKFSVVVETGTNEFEFSSHRRGEPWIIHTEKSYKPFAFRHPSLTWGPAGILAFLRAQGFETFNHVIDESYDTIKGHALRLDKVVETINDLNNTVKNDKQYFNDPMTIEKLEHNYNLFYNIDLALEYFKKEIVDPIYEFASKA